MKTRKKIHGHTDREHPGLDEQGLQVNGLSTPEIQNVYCIQLHKGVVTTYRLTMSGVYGTQLSQVDRFSSSW